MIYLANDKYNAALSSGYTVGQNTLNVNSVPDNVPTVVVVGYGTEKETVFVATGKTVNSLTGVSRLRGANVNLDAQTPVTCLNNQEFINQYQTAVFSAENLKTVVYAADGGSTDAYAITLSPAPTSYTNLIGVPISFKANTANVGPASLNVNGLGAKTIKKTFDQDLVDNDIKAGQIVTVVYDGTNFQMQSQVYNSSSGDGLTPLSATLTYASADGPIFVANTSVDLTGLIGVGYRIKLNQTTDKWFIVHAIDATTITLYGGTDYTLANAAISNVFYSNVKAPKGFPLNPDKWTVKVSNNTDLNQATPSQNTWYNPGTVKMDVPIGVWKLGYEAMASANRAAAGEVSQYATLSTANNSESDAEFTDRIYVANDTGVSGKLAASKILAVATKTPYYLNTKTSLTNGTQLNWLGNAVSPTIIKAVDAYL